MAKFSLNDIIINFYERDILGKMMMMMIQSHIHDELEENGLSLIIT